jgi:RHS repeat-associated protein
MDPNGNYMTYEYGVQDGEHLLMDIRYTGNAGMAMDPYNSVHFIYESRADKNELFVRGLGGIKTRHLLKTVEVYCEGELFKQYRLNYALRDIEKSYLREVGEYLADGSTGYNTTVIKYEDRVPTPLITESFQLNALDNDFFSGDFDGDGDSEIVSSTYDYTYDGLKFHTDLRIHRRDGSGILTETWSIALPNGTMVLNDQTVPTTYAANLSNDMDGDGREDIVVARVDNSGSGLRLDNFTIHYSTSNNATSFTPQSFNPPWHANSEYNKINSSTFKFQVPGDFNGDGLGDMVVVLANYAEDFHGFLYSPAAGINGQVLSITGGAFNICRSNYVAPIDFDGDGAQEILCVWQSLAIPPEPQAKIYRLKTWPSLGLEVVWSSGGFPTPQHTIRLGDFNGDGKTDLLTRYSDNTNWHIAYSTGTDFFEQQVQFENYINLGQAADLFGIADYNGDGKTDICHGYSNGGGSATLKVYYSRGLGQPFEIRTYPHDFFGFSPALITDLNGDGRSEVIDVEGDSFPMEAFFFDRNGHERAVDKVVNGMGAVVDFDYRYATANGEVLTNADFTYPRGGAKVPAQVADRMSASNGTGGMNQSRYFCSQGILDRTGKGFLGFKRTETIDVTGNRRSVQLSELNSNYASLVPSHTELRRYDTDELLQEADHDISLVTLGGLASRRHWTRLNSSTVSNTLAGTVTETTNSEWDAFGNLKKTHVDIGGVETSTTSLWYIAAGPSPTPAKVELAVVERQRTGQAAISTETWHGYDNATGKLTSTKEHYNTPAEVTTVYAYHPAGTLQSTTSSFLGLPGDQVRKAGFAYDSKARFVTWRANRWNNSGSLIDVAETIETEPRYGRPTRVLGADGLTTTMDYDGFGRLTNTRIPHEDGNPRGEISRESSWDLNGLQFFRTRVVEPNGRTVHTYHDLLGRTVGNDADAFGGELTSSAMGYDARGNMSWETTPHHSNEDFLTITHQYDGYGRKEKIVNDLTGTVQFLYDYSGGELTKRTTNLCSGTWSATVFDAVGNKVSILDDGGEVKLTYDSWGNTTHAHKDGFLLARNFYDAYGKQIRHYGPNSGMTWYKHDPFGQLTWQKDANGNEVTLAHDNLGRVIDRTGPDGSTTYSYFYENGRFTNAQSVVAGPTVTRTFSYDDPYNRLTEARSTIAGIDYVSRYGYDDLDNLTAEVFPSGLNMLYTYSLDGSLYSASTADGATLFEAVSKNGLGQYTSYRLADSRTVNKEYHHGFLERIQADDVQDLNLAIDYCSGNVGYRWDATKNLKEVFGYDDLNRLTSAQIFPVDASGTETGLSFPAVNYAYDGDIGNTDGNLTLRDDVGQLGYGVHAVTAARNIDYPTPPDAPPYAISQATQEISYTPYLKPFKVNEPIGADSYELEFEYGPEHQRTRSFLRTNGTTVNTRVYLGNYEEQTVEGTVQKIHYIFGGDGLCGIIVNDGVVDRTYAAYTDHLGSIVAVTKTDGGLVAEQNFDAWGRHRKPENWTMGQTQLPSWLYRGYTGHEHAEPFSLINMNSRMYDPLVGRMLSADNYVNGQSATQAFNRYSYAGNNPLSYTDPTGDIVWAPVIIGAAIGAYYGGMMANQGNFDPTMWNFSSGRTWKYMVGGAIIGGVSGGLGNHVATSGMVGANTAAIAAGSYSYSVGMSIMSGGRTPVSISLGAASYNFNTGEVGYLGDPENNTIETIGYSLGALANVSDVLAGLRPSSAELQTENLPSDGKDKVGHAQLNVDGEVLIDFGPAGDWKKFAPGRNDWVSFGSDGSYELISDIPGNKYSPVLVRGVNADRLHRISDRMNVEPGNYQVLFRSCSSTVSRSLSLSGAPAIGLHPYLLHAQLYLRDLGIRPTLFSYHMTGH